MSTRHDAMLMRVLSVAYPDYLERRVAAPAADLLFLVVEDEVDTAYVVEVTSISQGLQELGEIAPDLHPNTVAVIRKAQTTPNTFAALFVAQDGTSAYVLEHPAKKPAAPKTMPQPASGFWMRPVPYVQ